MKCEQNYIFSSWNVSKKGDGFNVTRRVTSCTWLIKHFPKASSNDDKLRKTFTHTFLFNARTESPLAQHCLIIICTWIPKTCSFMCWIASRTVLSRELFAHIPACWQQRATYIYESCELTAREQSSKFVLFDAIIKRHVTFVPQFMSFFDLLIAFYQLVEP